MPFIGRHLFALLLFCTGIAAWGHRPENIHAEEWSAQWIGPPAKITQEARQNSWWCFRKDIQVASAPEKCEIKIACDSKYWLWVNGELAVLEGGLKRGPTPTGTYYDVVDIATYLREGDNQIAILLWHFGKHGFSHNDSGAVGLIVDGECDDLTLRTDSSWKIFRHPAFEDAGDPQPNYRLPEGNIRFDARRTILDWQTASDPSQWYDAKEYGVPPVAPWGELMERPILQWKDSGVRDYDEVIETTADLLYKRARLRNPDRIKQVADEAQADGQTLDTRRVMVGTLPYNCHVHPIMSITAPAGLEIDIQTDLVTNGRDGFLRAEYVTREGRQEFELPGWLNGHEVRYFLPEGVDVHKIQYRETGYNAEFTGSFECDDERLNILWEKARRTLYVTMRDTYMDCPDRERAQWWGDAVNELGEAFYVFDAEKGPLLAKKGILELAAYQRSDKTLYSPVPAGVPVDDNRENPRDGSWNRELPRQMLASVGFYGFWNYYRNTGDAETIRKVYPAVRDYLSIWELDDRGLVVHRTGEWDWTDWGQNFDVAVLESAWYYIALKGAVEMASLLDLPDDAAAYRKKMKRIEGGFNKTFWQGEYYRSPSHEGETDDRANALAVVAGLAETEYYPAITEFLKTNMHASPYMEKYVLEALFLMRQPEAGIARIHQRYASMIDCDETTLWENFARKGSGEPGSGTYNHAWSGGPLTMMHQYIAGIEPIEPGWKRFSIRPQLGSLKHVETVVPTPYGDIELTIDRNDAGKYDIQLLVPDGATAEVEEQGTFKELPPGTHRLTVGIYLKQTSASQTIFQLTDFQVSATTANKPLVDIDFANIFANGCVLQRGQTVPIWGTATPGDTITVEIHGQSQQGIADGQGNWRIALEPETAGGPYTLGATGSVSGSAELTLVYFGDVWILTGQSNMYQTLGGQVRNFPDDYPAVPDNSDNFDDMRFAIVDIVTANTPADDVTMERSWTRWQKSALGSMSTVGYFFARALNEQMDANGMADVPLGFIKVCKGGTSIEEWIAEDKWRAAKTADPGLVVASDASGYYNGMMAPIQDYAIKGAIWYQGEAHTASITRIEQYPILKQTLVEAWREQWNNPDMPFYFVQLAPYKAYTPLPADELWAWMRESQESCQSISNTAMACIIDGGHQRQIHPPFKDRVGERLARLALDQTYGISTVHRGPTLKAMSISGSVATITFNNVASGLETRANDSQPDADEIAEGCLPVSVSANELAGFFLCGADKRFYPALEATITASNQVRVSNPSDVPSPVAVRYAFQNYPRCNLFNSEGLPAEPFRTDDYDFGEARAKTNSHTF